MWTMCGQLRMLALLLIFLRIQGMRALKNVSLEVIPVAVQRGGYASLQCHYDLEDAPLYSVKWYRGQYEFYRYSPSELPNNKIFPFPGIHVDVSQSNASQVVLRNVSFSLSGNFSCEVTTDATFATKVVSRHMMVVALPEYKPIIFTEKNRYNPGDILRANCSSPPSKPPTRLTFVINNTPQVNMGSSKQIPVEDLFSSELSLEILLLPHHYTGGRLVLKCTAEVGILYQESAEIQLGSRAGDPRSERVLSMNATTGRNLPSLFLHLVTLMLIYYIKR